MTYSLQKKGEKVKIRKRTKNAVNNIKKVLKS